ncbi:hypothetical protein [Bizionia sp.]|uniref:hypothetical protein n=1 Tax=Bizionia sp. TaxID=1954480 RepID=UPI003A931471
MSFKNYFTEKIPTIAILSSLLLVTACGTYQQVDDSDGIYSSSSVEPETYVEANNASSTYYENYFKEKSSELELYSENEVFTDVDDYEGEYVENDSLEVERESYAGWGQESSSVSVNIYNSGGFYSPYYSPFGYGYGYGYGYGSWGYGGYYSPWYGGGYGYYPPYYGGYYPPYYGGYYPPYYGGGYYYRNNVAYVNGRRGSMYANNSRRYASSRYYDSDRIYNAQARRSTTNGDVTRRSRTQSTYSTPRSTRSNNEVRTRTPRVDANTPRVRTNTNNTPRVRTNTNNTPRVRTNTNNTPRVRTNTTTQPRTNNSFSTPRRSSSPTMSTGGSRGSSSGGSVRSSGGRRGGGL